MTFVPTLNSVLLNLVAISTIASSVSFCFTTPNKWPCIRVLDFSSELTAFNVGLKVQKMIFDDQLTARVSGFDPIGTILMLQHFPTITEGSLPANGDHLAPFYEDDESWLPGLERANRGGLTTYHGPGQLIFYPIIDLMRLELKDCRNFLGKLQTTVIMALKRCGIEGLHTMQMPGLWVDGRKIVSMGITVKRWISLHGLSININPDLNYFHMINSCGLQGVIAGSLQQCGYRIDRACLVRILLEEFEKEFRVQCVRFNSIETIANAGQDH